MPSWDGRSARPMHKKKMNRERSVSSRVRFVAGGGVGVGWLCVTSFLISRLLAFSSVRAGPFLDASTRGGPGECRAVVHSPTSGSGSVPMHGTSMCHILDTLLHAGNCMADKSESGGGSDDPAFPCEDPTQPELEDWLKCMRDKLKKTEYLYLSRNETPPSLIGISVGINLDMMRQQPAPAGDETTDAFQKRSAWNFKCDVLCGTSIRATQLSRRTQA